MKALKFLLVISVSMVVVAACTDVSPETKLKAAKSAKPQSTPFYNELSKNYLDLAVFEVGQNDRHSTADYSKRSIIAGSGKTILPEEINKRSLPANAVSELTNARSQLLSALDSGGRKKHPAAAALAQAKFDCWMEQQEENLQPDHIAACKLQWTEAMAKLGVTVKSPPKKMTKVFIIYFDFDKSNITAASNAILDEVILAKKAIAPKHILLGGHTDSAGPSNYNNALSERRVQATIKALAKRSVAAAAINAKHYGEAKLKIPTGDGVKEAGNRRVEIYFVK